jgi:hypothetical protein
MSVSLYDLLNQSYIEKDGRSKHIGDYIYDNELSNDESMVYHNPNENKLLIGFRGTNNLDDLQTDALLAVGQLRSTDRYKRSNNTYREAKNKYKGSKTTLIGHSMGSSLSSAIGDDDDLIISLNKGTTIFGNSTKTKKNEKSYKVDNDLVNNFDNNAIKIKPKKSLLYKFLVPKYIQRYNDHSVENIKNKNIYI